MAAVKVLLAVVLGVMLGLVYTIRILDAGDRRVVAGPWQGSPRDGAPDVDPYTLAANERSSRLPLGVAEGLTFVARTDDGGTPLAGACEYAVRGPMPSARYWTLSLLDERGTPLTGPAERYGFTSAEVLRQTGAPVEIAVAPEARSGNWLPTGRAAPFVLMLRLYDTGLGTAGSVFDAATMPRIIKMRCP